MAVWTAWVMLDVDELLEAGPGLLPSLAREIIRPGQFPSEAPPHYVSLRFRLSKREFNALELHLLL